MQLTDTMQRNLKWRLGLRFRYSVKADEALASASADASVANFLRRRVMLASHTLFLTLSSGVLLITGQPLGRRPLRLAASTSTAQRSNVEPTLPCSQHQRRPAFNLEPKWLSVSCPGNPFSLGFPGQFRTEISARSGPKRTCFEPFRGVLAPLGALLRLSPPSCATRGPKLPATAPFRTEAGRKLQKSTVRNERSLPTKQALQTASNAKS